MKRSFIFLIIFVTACILLCGAIARRARIASFQIDEAPVQSDRIGTLHCRGSLNAPVTLEEFGDFECAPCARLFDVIKQLQTDSGRTLRVVFRHYPLGIHSRALAAALAAEAAGAQGRFWEMHDLLYQEQAVWSSAPDSQAVFNEYAKRLDLNVEQFRKYCFSDEAKARVSADKQRAAERGVRQTPTLFINDWVVPRESYSTSGLRTRIAMMAASLPQPTTRLSSEQRSVEGNGENAPGN